MHYDNTDGLDRSDKEQGIGIPTRDQGIDQKQS